MLPGNWRLSLTPRESVLKIMAYRFGNIPSVYSEYVRLKKPIQREIERLEQIYLATKGLCVHARFTDAQAGFENRSVLPMAKYFQSIDEYIIINRVDRIFVATILYRLFKVSTALWR